MITIICSNKVYELEINRSLEKSIYIKPHISEVSTVFVEVTVLRNTDKYSDTISSEKCENCIYCKTRGSEKCENCIYSKTHGSQKCENCKYSRTHSSEKCEE